MTLKQWKCRLQVGVRLRCSFRHYAGPIDEVVTIKKVQAKAIAYDYDGASGSFKLKPGQLAWMDFPKQNGIRFTVDGFELLMPDGSVMSRYHWLTAKGESTSHDQCERPAK